MAAPTIRAVGTVDAAVTAITPGLPAGTVAGDLLIMFLETNADEAITVSGWTQAPSSPQTGGTAGVTAGATRLTIFYKIAVGSDARTTSDSGNHQVGRIIGITAGTFDATTPFNTSAGDGSATVTQTVTIPGGTTTRAECLIIAAVATGLPDATGTNAFGDASWANASLASITEQIDNSTATGGGGAIGVAAGVLTAAGTYNATTGLCSDASAQARISLAVQPPATGNTGTIAVTQASDASAMSGTVIPPNTGTVASTQDPQLAVGVVPGYADLITGVGGEIATPDHADLDFTGDIDIRTLVALPDWTPSQAHALIAKAASPTTEWVSLFVMPAGTLLLGWSNTTKSAVSTAATGFAANAKKWVRATLDVNNGAGGNTATFYTSDDGIAWIQLGLAVVGAGTTALVANNESLNLGSYESGGSSTPSHVYYAEIRNGIGGTVVTDPDFRDDDQITTPDTVFTDTTGKAWTLTAPAVWEPDVPTPGWIGTVTNPPTSGTIAVTQAGDTGAISGSVLNPISGTIAASQADQAGAFAGSLNISGTVAATQAPDVGAMAGTVANSISGTIGVTQADDTGAFTGDVVSDGTLNAIQANQTGAINGTVVNPITGVLGATQADDVGAFAGTSVVSITGTLAAVQGDDTAAIAGDSVSPAVSGTLAATQDDDTMAANGIAAFGVAGTISVTQDDDVMAASGVAQVAVTGVLDATQADQTMTATGSVVNLVAGAVVSVTCTIGGPTLACVIGGPTATCTISPVSVIAGSNFIVTATFRDAMGDLADPTSVSAVIQAPDGTQSTPTPTSSSVGVWTTVVPTDQAGFWFYQITGEGNEIDVVCHGSVCVEPALVLV